MLRAIDPHNMFVATFASDAIDRMIGDALKDVMQIALRVDAIEFAGLHKTADDHRAAGYLATALSHTVRVP